MQPVGRGRLTEKSVNKCLERTFYSEEQLRKGVEFTPWYSGLSKFDSQKHTGGFGKIRDVCPHIKDISKEFQSDDKLQVRTCIV